MTREPDREIVTAEDADSIREDIESVFDGWFADDARIDWGAFIDRLERGNLDMGDDMNSPAIRRIRAIVRELRSQQQ